MKKVILTMCVAGALLATSCKKEKEETKETIVETIEKVTEENTEAATKAVEKVETAVKETTEAVKSAIEGIEIPEFSSPKAAKFLQSYSQYAKDYIAAKGDVLKNAKLAKRGVELAGEGKKIATTLDAKGVKKFNSVMVAIQSKMAPAK